MITFLKLAKEVLLGDEDCVVITPPEGNVWLYNFYSESGLSSKAAVKIVWKYGEPDEELVWSSKDGGKLISGEFDRILVGVQLVGGTFKAALCLENSCVNDYYMSGQASIEHEEI